MPTAAARPRDAPPRFLGEIAHLAQRLAETPKPGGLGFTTGRALQFPGVPHNRLLLSLAHAMGHTDLVRFGNPDYCDAGPLTGLA